MTLLSLVEPGCLLYLYGPVAPIIANLLVAEAVKAGWAEVRWSRDVPYPKLEARSLVVSPVRRGDHDVWATLLPEVRGHLLRHGDAFVGVSADAEPPAPWKYQAGVIVCCHEDGRLTVVKDRFGPRQGHTYGPREGGWECFSPGAGAGT